MEKNNLWKNLLYAFLGTTLSILLTFGTSMLLEKNKQKEERELTAWISPKAWPQSWIRLEETSRHILARPSSPKLSKEFRQKAQEIHTRAPYTRYMAEVVRYYNSVNMVIMHVTKEEVQKFIDEHEEGLENDYPLPNQQDYLQVEINPDSLPDYQTWFNQHQW